MEFPNRLRVLYAENNEEACFMLSILLGFSGVDVSCAHTIKQAFEAARNKSFDMYLLGSKFSDGSNLELCRQLREFNPQTPVVFYSNDAHETDRQKGLAAGAEAYLIKPEIDTVLPTILRLVSQVSDSQMPVRRASLKGQNKNRKIASDFPGFGYKKLTSDNFLQKIFKF